MKQDVNTVLRYDGGKTQRGEPPSIRLLSPEGPYWCGGRPRGADHTADEWAELRKLDGAKLLLKGGGGDFEIQEPDQWWERYLEAINRCLKRGKIMAYVKSGQVVTMVLMDGPGNRTTIHKPWRLW